MPTTGTGRNCLGRATCRQSRDGGAQTSARGTSGAAQSGRSFLVPRAAAARCRAETFQDRAVRVHRHGNVFLGQLLTWHEELHHILRPTHSFLRSTPYTGSPQIPSLPPQYAAAAACLLPSLGHLFIPPGLPLSTYELHCGHLALSRAQLDALSRPCLNICGTPSLPPSPWSTRESGGCLRFLTVLSPSLLGGTLPAHRSLGAQPELSTVRRAITSQRQPKATILFHSILLRPPDRLGLPGRRAWVAR